MTRALLVLIALAGCGDDGPTRPAATSRLPAAPAVTPPASAFGISGTVIDRDTRAPVGNVEVVLRGEHGDVTTKTAVDGTFKLALARGAYRAFVRDDHVMSTGMQGRLRLRSLPRAELAGAPDDQLMPLLEVDGEITGIELTVTAGARIDGTVTDPNGKPAGAVVISAVALETPGVRGMTPSVATPIVRRVAPRPVLGTDTAISAADGTFSLRVPAGRYSIVANHPRFAGIGGLAELELDAGSRATPTVTLVRGCVITGKVVAHDGKPVHDGAIETQRMQDFSFGATGRIHSDGTFRWTTTDSGLVAIRAWPWRQPASTPRTFDCSDGKIYDGVVLPLSEAEPDIAGTITDARGNPVPLAYIDVASLDRRFDGQQERANAAGEFSVFDMPPGRYDIAASAAGRGVVAETITAPRRDVALRLSGVGRIVGTTPDLADGSFELVFHHCGGSADPIEVDDDARIVVVRGGRFTVERVPACTLTMSARWRDKVLTHAVVVEPDRSAFVELELGTPRSKRVHGVVRDERGEAVANARVTALVDHMEATSVRSDGDGRYVIETQSGAQLVAGNGSRLGRATVGRANVASEQVDITLGDDADDVQ